MNMQFDLIKDCEQIAYNLRSTFGFNNVEQLNLTIEYVMSVADQQLPDIYEEADDIFDV